MSDKNENRSSDESAVKSVSSVATNSNNKSAKAASKSRKGNSKKRKANSGQKMQKANCDSNNSNRDHFYRTLAAKDTKPKPIRDSSRKTASRKVDGDECNGSRVDERRMQDTDDDSESSSLFNEDDERIERAKSEEQMSEQLETWKDSGRAPDAKSNKCDENSAQKKKFKDELTGEWLCPVCDTKLDSQHSFTVHIRQHNPTDHSHTCSICGKTLSSASSLDRHMLIHSGERPFKCRICNMAFTTNGNMHRHMRTHGMELNEHDSHHDSNNNRFKSKKRKSNEDATRLQTSSPKTRRQSDGDGIMNMLPSEQFHCQVCGKGFVSKSALNSHMEVHPNDPINCRDCGALLANFTLLAQHRCFSNLYNSNKSALTPPSPVGFYDLTFTDFSSSKFSLIAKSYCEHNIRKSSSSYHDFECSKCEKAFPCGSALNLHQSGHNEDTYCHVCRCDLGTPALYMNHKLKHRIESSLPLNGISSSHEFVNNINGMHDKPAFSEITHSDKEGFLALLQLQNKNTDSPLSPTLKFDRNEEVFDNASYYIHAKPSTTKKPITFKPKVVNGGGSDAEHGKHDLADIQSIISVTSTATPLITRIRSSPPAASPASPVESSVGQTKPDSPVPADSPNESATVLLMSVGKDNTSEEEKTEVENESKTNTEEEERKENDASEAEDKSFETLKCNTCNLELKSANALKRHNRGHTQGGHSYACHLCQYTSLDKSTLVRHLRTHNGERPFQCAICKYAFTTKANCERHVRKRHKKTSKHEIRNAMQYNPNMSTSNLTVQNLSKHNSMPVTADFPGNNDTVCKYCNADFKYNRVLRHHLRSLHNSCSRKPYSCTVCKLGFSTKNNCVRHVLKQHPEYKDKTSSVVVTNGSSTASNSCSDYSESESLTTAENLSQKWNQDSSLSSSNFNFDSQRQCFVSQQKPSSLAALCQIAGRVAGMENGVNLVSGSEDCDGDESSDNVDEQPLDLAKMADIVKPSGSEDEPLDLAVHALDLSLKPKKSIVPDNCQDLRKCSDETVRNAATSLLSLQSMVPRAETFLPPTGLIHPSLPIQAHSSSLLPVSLPQRQPSPLPLPLPPTASLPNSTLVKDIYRLSALRVNKGPLIPKNQRSFTCIYCSAGFTLKSNMERHIKRKHPEFARPPRIRGSSAAAAAAATVKDVPSSNGPISLLSKPNGNTLSNKTRAALRVVLNNKAIGSTSSNLSIGSNGSRASSPVSDNNASTETNQSRDDVVGDLASVSSLIADTANSSNTLKQYFNKSDENETKSVVDCENLSKSDSTSVRPEEDAKSTPSSVNGDAKTDPSTIVIKKRSAYTDSPNSVSCPYCSRRFPWTSSLRRHILTHTGLKPYKCPKCPILFTTKSNCERHLVRKHGSDSKKLLRSEMSNSISQETKQFKCNLCVNSYFINQGNLKKHYYLRHWTKSNKGPSLLRSRSNSEKADGNQNIPEDTEGTKQSFDLIFRCHICEDESFTDRLECLSHLQSIHSNEYETLLSKGAVDKVPTSETKLSLAIKSGEVSTNDNKIYCVFCPRQFSSDENLRRHMRVHLGDRPFKCTWCTRKFSLKNSLLRHYRTNHPDVPVAVKSKNKRRLIDEKQTAMDLKPTSEPAFGLSSNSDTSEVKDAGNDDTNDGGDLIQNLLGIEDSKMLDEMLNSADSAARLLGVKEALEEIRN